MSPDQHLKELANLFQERNKQYGSNYLQFEIVLRALFPNGIIATCPGEAGRLILVMHLITKLTRYTQNMQHGKGHKDSLDDLAVYAMMLQEHDSLYTQPEAVPAELPIDPPGVDGEWI